MGRLVVLSCFLLICLVSESTCMSLFKSRNSLNRMKARQFKEALRFALGKVHAEGKRGDSQSGTTKKPPLPTPPPPKKDSGKRGNSSPGTTHPPPPPSTPPPSTPPPSTPPPSTPPPSTPSGQSAYKRDNSPSPPSPSPGSPSSSSPSPGSPPPPSPQDKSIWYFMNIKKEEFINEHKDSLTSEVRSKLSRTMDISVNMTLYGLEYAARWMSCMVLSGYDKKRSANSTSNDTLSDVESQIENVEEEEKRTLDDLFYSLGINETGLQHAHEYRPPKFIMDCMSSDIIMDVGNIEFDRIQRFVVCARLGMVKTKWKMEKHNVDSVRGFVNRFEEFLKGVISFGHLYLQSHGGAGEDPLSFFISKREENEMEEVERLLRDYIAASSK